MLLTISSLAFGFSVEMEYQEYLGRWGASQHPQEEIRINLYDFRSNSPDIVLEESFQGRPGATILTDESGYVEWDIYVEEAGLYNIELTYFPIKGKNSAIQRELQINGEVPFMGAKFLTFHRAWADAEPIRRDNRGNELRPSQIENPVWLTVTFRDDMGYYTEPYSFYFNEGVNTIRLVARKEPLAIGEIRLYQQSPAPSYAEVAQSYEIKNYPLVKDRLITIQAESATLKSDPTLYAIQDQGDPTVEPYDPALIRLNSIGGHRWQSAGQWLRWEFDVPETGLYKIALKSKQNMLRGSYVNRRVLINGEVPFQELEAVRFRYHNRYEMHVLGEQDLGEPYLFYLKEGKNTIQLEVVLGDLAELIRTAESSLYELNNMYRQILMITSSTPDLLRDYELHKRIPQVIENLQVQSEVLAQLSKELESYTGEKGSHVALLDDLSRQLADMAKRPDTIPKRLGAYRDNISGLGTWILETREQPLQLDSLIIASLDAKLPKAAPSKLEVLTHEVKAFGASFVVDYNLVGDVFDGSDDGREPLTVWVSTGRDQAQFLKDMIEDTFTPQTGIRVNLQLVNMGVLLPATLAGLGPDVALGVPASDPINFAIRNSVLDLTQFSDFPEVAKRFMPSAIVPFTFRDKVYALPEQQPFPMLFYRTDILNELNLEIPQTWDDVIKIIPELQKEHMNFGLPISETQSSAGAGDVGTAAAGAGSLSAHQGVIPFLTFLYQQGGNVYLEDGVATDLDSELAVASFRRWTELYELYKLPLSYNAANRFRIGEIPILVAGYPLYNLLSVSAPEIRGRWDFTLVPGTLQADGTIDRTVPGGSVDYGAASIIMKDAHDPEAAWEFISWWTSTETQVRYGRELESLLGASARYPTANVEALRQLPWSVDEYEKLYAQWKAVRGVPEVPGGYMIGRHLDNAFRKVVYQQQDPRKTLLDYVRVINEEIKLKRAEFGLDSASQ
jgi:ABC-type glycerol-3-phosphate transport system substrate-binding protein